jgi:hypothetical protein
LNLPMKQHWCGHLKHVFQSDYTSGMARIVFILLVLLQGCDLFSTRDPEKPTERSSEFKPPVTSDLVLDNFKSAIIEHNINNYLRCFVDTTKLSKRFSFSPSADFQGIFSSWGTEEERRYFENLGNPVPEVPALEFFDLIEQNKTAASTEYTMNYVLYYPHHQAGVARQVRGYMHLYLALDSQQWWAIYEWDDRKTVSDSTWSYLKYHVY